MARQFFGRYAPSNGSRIPALHRFIIGLSISIAVLSSAFLVPADFAVADEGLKAQEILKLDWGLNPVFGCCVGQVTVLKSRHSPEETDYQFLKQGIGGDYARSPFSQLYLQESDLTSPEGGRTSVLKERSAPCHSSGVRIRHHLEGFDIVYAVMMGAIDGTGPKECSAPVRFVTFTFPTDGCQADLCISKDWHTEKAYADVDSAFTDAGLSLPGPSKDLEPSRFIPLMAGLFVLISVVFWCLFGYPVSRILRRVGISGWWSLLALVPYGNLIALWVFAFAKWPSLDGPQLLAQPLRPEGDGTPPRGSTGL